MYNFSLIEVSLLLKNYMGSKWHLIIKFRCQSLSLTVNFWGVYFFGFVYIPSEVVGLQTSQATVPISEITEMVTKLDVKSFSQPLAVWSLCLFIYPILAVHFFLMDYHPKCFDWRVFILVFYSSFSLN